MQAFSGREPFTDGDVAGIQFAANSEASPAETVARYRFRDARSIAGPRFSAGEWGYEGFGQEHFIPFGPILATAGQARSDRKSFAFFREWIDGPMIERLAAVDLEGSSASERIGSGSRCCAP